MLLRSLLDNEHAQTGLEYKSWLAHGDRLRVGGAGGARARGRGAAVLRVRYRESPEADAEEARLADAAVQLLNGYVHASFALRESWCTSRPPPHKSVFRTPVGVAGEGYALVHDFVQDAQSPLWLEALNALFKATIASDCCQDAGDIGEFIANTSVPGLKAAGEAARWRRLQPHRHLPDQLPQRRACQGGHANPREAAESWLHELPRSPISADDCDGSARCALGVLRTAAGISKEQAAEYEYLNAVKNVVSTYYEPALVVLGATAAEATSADASHSAIAGHAIAMLLPKISLLSAWPVPPGRRSQTPTRPCTRPARRPWSKTSASMRSSRTRKGSRPRRRRCCPAGTWQRMHQSWRWSRSRSGTTPASPVLHESVAARRDRRRSCPGKTTAFGSPPTLSGRSSACTSSARAGTTSTASTRPSWSHLRKGLSALLQQGAARRGAAASQFVFAQNDSTVSVAGTSPKQLVDGDYVLMPLISLPGAALQVIDERRRCQAQRRRSASEALSCWAPWRAAVWGKSIALLDSLHAQMHERREGGHPIAYNVALSTLVFNPESVAAFCSVVAKQACRARWTRPMCPVRTVASTLALLHKSRHLPRAPALHKSRRASMATLASFPREKCYAVAQERVCGAPRTARTAPSRKPSRLCKSDTACSRLRPCAFWHASPTSASSARAGLLNYSDGGEAGVYFTVNVNMHV